MTRQRWSPTPRTIAVADPAAGAGLARVNDSGGLWVVTAVLATLATSAVVADRTVRLILGTAERVRLRTQSYVVQPASLTRDYVAFSGSAWASVAGSTIAIGWPTDGAWLSPGETVTIEVDNIDVGDQISGVVLDLVEYPDVLPAHLTPSPYLLTESDQE